MTPPAASLRTRRDTAAVHTPPAGARRLPPLALLHPVREFAVRVLREIVTAVVRFVRSFAEFEFGEYEHQCSVCYTDGHYTLYNGHHQCADVYGFCPFTCITVRLATRAFNCTVCGEKLTNCHMTAGRVWDDLEAEGRRRLQKEEAM